MMKIICTALLIAFVGRASGSEIVLPQPITVSVTATVAMVDTTYDASTGYWRVSVTPAFGDNIARVISTFETTVTGEDIAAYANLPAGVRVSEALTGKQLSDVVMAIVTTRAYVFYGAGVTE